MASGQVLPPVGGILSAAEIPADGDFCHRCYVERSVHGSWAEPVNTATGAFYEIVNDDSIPGDGLPLTWTRTYSSVLASQTGRLGAGWTDSYNTSLSVDAPTGNVTLHGPDGSATLFTLSGTTYSAPPRIQATLVKNGDGTYTLTQNLRTTYNFDNTGKLTKETDLNGYATTLTYSGGLLTTVTDPSSRTLRLAYTGRLVHTVTDSGGRVVTYGYDGGGNLTSVTDVGGKTWTYTYDANHRLLTVTDPRGGRTTNHYDTSGRVIEQDDPLNRATTFSYTGTPLSAGGGMVVITDPKGNATQEQYAQGERIAVTRGYGTPQSATWQYRFDPDSLGVSTTVDPNGHVTSAVYDSHGNVVSSTDALGRTTTATYDSLNDVTSITDPLGVSTSMTYDSKGNLLTRSRPLIVNGTTTATQTTSYQYGDTAHPGDPTGMTDPDGKQFRYTYDSHGDLASSTDPLGDKTTYTYDVLGRRLTAVAPLGNIQGGTSKKHTTTMTYDAYGDVLTVADPLGDTVTKAYDADRNLAALKDADGNTTTYTYDAANELTLTTRADKTTLKTDYWPDGSVKDQVDGAGHTTSYIYDPLRHLTSTTDPLGRVTTFSYDAVGNLLSRQDPVTGASCTTPKVGCTTYGYDAANELTAITYTDGATPNVTMAYDADGQRISMTDGTGTSTYTWDTLHRLASTTDGAGSHVGYAYNLRNLVTTLTYPDNTTVTHTFDDAGRLTALADWSKVSTRFTYDADSNLVGETAPGVIGTFGVDNADRLTSISYASGTKSLLALSLSRDANGQLTKATTGGTLSNQYTYTALNQLRADTTTPYSYDSADNLILNNTTTQSFDAAGELCWTAPVAGTSCASPPALLATTYSYDSRGDRTAMTPPSGPATTYGYDQARRLTSYTSGTTTATYTYDGDGLRMSKTVGGTPQGIHLGHRGQSPAAA